MLIEEVESAPLANSVPLNLPIVRRWAVGLSHFSICGDTEAFPSGEAPKRSPPEKPYFAQIVNRRAKSLRMLSGRRSDRLIQSGVVH